jgi:hypothetical protein
MNYFILVNCLISMLVLLTLVIGFKRTTLRLDRIIEGQRLSTIIKLEPTSLEISPEDFEANKEILKQKLLDVFAEEKHPSPSTRAYCILNHSGYDIFVEGNTRLKIQNALARLLVNNNTTKTKRFLGKIVKQL